MKLYNCVKCGSNRIKKYGHIHNGKQRHCCKCCGFQFVEDNQKRVINDLEKALVERLLLERISLRGICRCMHISLTWLLNFMVNLYHQCPEDLNFKKIKKSDKDGKVLIYQYEVEADEMWSFVDKKANKQWIWLALDSQTRQIIAFHVGRRNRQAAKEVWKKIPQFYQEHGQFYTDEWDPYCGVIPEKQHTRCAKGTGLTNHIERFNCTLRQRASRLVRKTLSFSKKLKNHIGAIKYFICHYNLLKGAALHV